MAVLSFALLAAALSVPTTAQNSVYTVHSSVIFARTGEHTPFLGGQDIVLTSWGARQLYNLGTFFRNRYITLANSSTTDPNAAAITGLNSRQIDSDQTVILTTNDQPTIMGSQAFMQAFYPPYTLASGTAPALDPSSVLADDTYVENPMNGYQYPAIQTFGAYDPNLVFLSGESNCQQYANAALRYYNSSDYTTVNDRTTSFYQSIGSGFLQGILGSGGWNFGNAYMIYNYMNYMNMHNATVRNKLNTTEYSTALKKLYQYASIKQFYLHGNLTADGKYTGDRILTISGQTLGAKILSQLFFNTASQGANNKVNLMVGDYPSMTALFAVLGLTEQNPYFELLPSWASAAVFELFSWENATSVAVSNGDRYPTANRLFVRFSFRNTTGDGSTSSTDMQSYPLFGRAPSQLDMPWRDFVSVMETAMLSSVADWCTICSSTALFCPAFTQTSASGSAAAQKKGISPQVAGVIGAGVTIGVLSLLFAIFMIIGGVRFRQNDGSPLAALFARFRRRKGSSTGSTLGGFKGSAKLASDTDLHIPKNAAPIGIAVTGIDHHNDDYGSKKGHERVGSWELKNGSPADEKPAMDEGRFSSLTGSTAARGSTVSNPFEHDDGNYPVVMRRSFEGDERAAEAELDRIGSLNPVRADERV